MNFFVTGVGGQLGHDVMNELLKRGHEGVGSDIQEPTAVWQMVLRLRRLRM